MARFESDSVHILEQRSKYEISTMIKEFCVQESADQGIYKIMSDVYIEKVTKYNDTREMLHNFIERTVDGFEGVKVFRNGGKGIDYFKNRQLDFVKVYKFLKEQPNKFYNPVTLRITNPVHHVIEVHPGSAKITIMSLFDNPTEITCVVPTVYESLTEKIQKYSHDFGTVYSSDSVCLERLLNIDDLSSNSIQLKLFKEKKIYPATFEISEDHRDIPNFVDQEHYIVDVSNTHIRLNDEILFKKTDGKWRYIK